MRIKRTQYQQYLKRIHPKGNLNLATSLSLVFSKPAIRDRLFWSTPSGIKISKDFRISSLYWNRIWVLERERNRGWESLGWPTSLCLYQSQADSYQKTFQLTCPDRSSSLERITITSLWLKPSPNPRKTIPFIRPPKSSSSPILSLLKKSSLLSWKHNSLFQHRQQSSIASRAKKSKGNLWKSSQTKKYSLHLALLESDFSSYSLPQI